MITSYIFHTKEGVFRIIEHAERWQVRFQGETLGSYATPQQAADDVAAGLTLTPSSGLDTSTLGIPHELSKWQAV